MESLVAMAVLVVVAGLVLQQINKNRQVLADSLYQQEVLSVATMAVQTKKDHLSLNGVSVTVNRSKEGIYVYEGGKEVVRVVKN